MEESIKDFRDWLSTHQKDDPWLRDKKIDRELNKLYRFNRALNRKAAIGVYGQSQAGKSFLISSLLKNEVNPTKIKVGQEEIRFDKLNPDQGAEATAVTCRFTTDLQTGKGNYVQGEFHTVGELIRILFAAIQELDMTEQVKAIEEYSFDKDDIPTGGTNLEQYQVFDLLDHIHFLITDYGRQSQVGETLEKIYSIIENHYLDQLSIKTVKYLVSFLWSGFNTFENIVEELFELYSVVGNKETFELHQDILKETLNTSVLMAPLEKQPKVSIDISSNVQISPGKKFHLSIIQIACSELIFPLANKSDLLEEIDLLDFPGLRPLAEHNNLQIPAEIANNYLEIIKTIKQGKLKSTFNLYSNRVEIPSLLLVTGVGNQEAQSLPKLVNKWMQQNCSNLEENVDSVLVNKYLFTAMTKSDKLLKDTNTLAEDDIIGRIQNRFSIHFENFFNEFLSGIEGYNNVFMTINKSVAEHQLIEGDFRQLAKNIFISHELVQKYLGEKSEETFESLYKKDGGVELLKTQLIEVSRELSEKKVAYITDSITAIQRKILHHAENYLVDPDDEEQLKKERKKAKLFSNLLERNKSLFSVLSHYQSYYFPENISFSRPVKEEDPLGLDTIFDDQNSEKDDYIESYYALLDTYFNSLTEKQSDYKFNKNYLSKIDEAELKYYFTKVIEYLKHNESVVDSSYSVYSFIDVQNKYQKRAFIQYLKYLLVSEITGYRNTNEGKKPYENISNNLEHIYTSSIPEFDEQANKDLETIINNLSQI